MNVASLQSIVESAGICFFQSEIKSVAFGQLCAEEKKAHEQDILKQCVLLYSFKECL